MELKSKKFNYQLSILFLLAISWYIRFYFTNVIDVLPILFIIVILIYRFKGKLSVTNTLQVIGVKKLDSSKQIIYVLAAIFLAFIASFLLIKITRVDLSKLEPISLSFAEAKKAKEYSKVLGTMDLLNFFIVGTFMEEFFFRGLIFRGFLLHLDFGLANILQAVAFGLLHLLMVLNMQVNYELYIFFFATIGGLLLGYVYYKTNKNLTASWITHYLLNTITLIVYFCCGTVI